MLAWMEKKEKIGGGLQVQAKQIDCQSRWYADSASVEAASGVEYHIANIKRRCGSLAVQSSVSCDSLISLPYI